MIASGQQSPHCNRTVASMHC